MSRVDYHIKRNDTENDLQVTLKEQGQDADLSDAVGVTFKMKNQDTGAVKVDSAASIDDAQGGEISYAWNATDTDTAGTYEAEFEVDFGAGEIKTYPVKSNDNLIIKIHEDIS